MPSKAARQKAQATLIFQTIQHSPALQDILATATSDNQKTFFTAKLLATLPNAFPDHTASPPQLFDIVTTWFGKHKDGFSKFNAVDTSLKHRRQYFIDHRNLKLKFIHRIGLNWSPATRDLFFQGVKTVSLQKLRTPYPLIKHWICESATINDKWSNYLKFNPRAQPDQRHKRQPIFHIHPSHLSLDIGADQSVVVYDAATGQHCPPKFLQ